MINMLKLIFLMYILNELHPLPHWVIVAIWALGIFYLVLSGTATILKAIAHIKGKEV